MKDQVVDQLLEIAKISSEQERDRTQNLLVKSDYLVKYITATFVFLNAIYVFLLKLDVVKPIWIVLLYVVPGILLCVAMWKAIKAQELVDVKFFPTGSDVIQGMVNRWKKTQEETSAQSLKLDKISYYREYTDSLKTANDAKAMVLQSVYHLFAIDLWIILIGIAGITILVAQEEHMSNSQSGNNNKNNQGSQTKGSAQSNPYQDAINHVLNGNTTAATRAIHEGFSLNNEGNQDKDSSK